MRANDGDGLDSGTARAARSAAVRRSRSSSRSVRSAAFTVVIRPAGTKSSFPGQRATAGAPAAGRRQAQTGRQQLGICHGRMVKPAVRADRLGLPSPPTARPAGSFPRCGRAREGSLTAPVPNASSSPTVADPLARESSPSRRSALSRRSGFHRPTERGIGGSVRQRPHSESVGHAEGWIMITGMPGPPPLGQRVGVATVRAARPGVLARAG